MAGDKQNGGPETPIEWIVGILGACIVMYYIGIPVLSFINDFFNAIGNF